MKIGIVFFGLTRNLKTTYWSIYRNIFQPLTHQKIAFHVFLHTYSLDKLTNKRSQEKDAILDNNEWKMLRPLRYLVEDQNEIDKVLPMDQFCSYPNPWPEDDTLNSMKNMLRSLHSLRQTWNLIQDTSYDAYLILRPDLLYMDPLYLNFNIRNDTIYIPDWGKARGENDRFCLCTKNVAEIYLKRYDHLFEFAEKNVPNSHTFLKYVLDMYHIKRVNLHVRAIRIRADKEKIDRESIEKIFTYRHYMKSMQLY